MKKGLSLFKWTGFLLGTASFFAPYIALASQLEDIEGVPNKPIEDVLADTTGWLIWFGVSLCLAALIWGGLSYVSALGSQENAQKAKKTITYAILGLLVIGLSYAIIALVDNILIPH